MDNVSSLKRLREYSHRLARVLSHGIVSSLIFWWHGWHDGGSTRATVFLLRHNQLSLGDRDVGGSPEFLGFWRGEKGGSLYKNGGKRSFSPISSNFTFIFSQEIILRVPLLWQRWHGLRPNLRASWLLYPLPCPCPSDLLHLLRRWWPSRLLPVLQRSSVSEGKFR